MKKCCILSIIVVFLPITLLAQEEPLFHQTVKGTVYDAVTAQPISNVNIQIEEETTGGISDSIGQFAIQSKTGRIVIQLSHINYESRSVSL
ncbi:MAG: carboxypeptidase-like regulatory domain-containing protein, partial [Bacteroidales bacterium]